MNIEKQMIDQRVNKIMEDNAALFSSYSADTDKQKSYAFLLLGVGAFLDIDVSPAFPHAALSAGYPLSSAIFTPEAALHRVLVFVLFPVHPVPTSIKPDPLATLVLRGEASKASAITDPAINK